MVITIGGQHAPVCNKPESFLSYQGGQHPPECHKNNGLKSSVFNPESGGQHGPVYPVGQFTVKQAGQFE